MTRISLIILLIASCIALDVYLGLGCFGRWFGNKGEVSVVSQDTWLDVIELPEEGAELEGMVLYADGDTFKWGVDTAYIADELIDSADIYYSNGASNIVSWSDVDSSDAIDFGNATITDGTYTP